MPERLLDDQALTGQHPISRAIGPELNAFLVGESDIAKAYSTIEMLMDDWGGGASALLPFDVAEAGIPASWSPTTAPATLDSICSQGLIDGSAFDASLAGVRLVDRHRAEPLALMLIAQEFAASGSRWRADLSLPHPNDPWYLAYVATFGVRGKALPEWVLRMGQLRPDLQLDELVDVVAESVLTHPSGSDLVSRLRDFSSVSPRTLSLVGLSYRPAHWSQDLVIEPTWSSETWTREFVGSNVAVVYERDSVADLALLWNLRAAHAYPRGLPLGVPVESDVASTLRMWGMPDGGGGFAGKLQGFGRPFAVTSLSVAFDKIEALASEAGGMWKAVEAEELMPQMGRAARVSVDVGHFRDGVAVVPALDRATAELFARRPRQASRPQVHVNVSLERFAVPHLRTLRNDHAFMPGWRSGGFDRELSGHSGTMNVSWPRGWTVAKAAFADHGLIVRPSRPGVAAAAFLNRIGATHELDALRHPGIIKRLEKLAQRRGMSWFKDRLRRLENRVASADSPSATASVEAAIDELLLTARDGDESHLSVGSDGLLKGKSDEAWFEWAELRGLLVRGFEVNCESCAAKSWRPVQEISPEVTCRGCGRRIDRPFRASGLSFRYRASQALLEIMSFDALPHLLACGWWEALFRDQLFGFHPGVEVIGATGEVLAEIDVVLVLANGRLALGECKRTSRALLDSDVDALERIADQCNAVFTFYAVPEWKQDCSEQFLSLERRLPSRPRFTLGGEQMLRKSYEVVSLMGVDVTEDAREEDLSVGIPRSFEDSLMEEIGRLRKPGALDDHLFRT